ncbi:MAG: hypothetical protein ACRBBW_03995 [Cellvibrionaceae bacterium]
MSTQAVLQKWADKYGVKGIRFYPVNATESASEGILTSAHNAIKAIEAGRVVAFDDPIKESE